MIVLPEGDFMVMTRDLHVDPPADELVIARVTRGVATMLITGTIEWCLAYRNGKLITARRMKAPVDVVKGQTQPVEFVQSNF